MRVTIGLITCKRPNGLKRLLDGINQLEFQKTQPTSVDVVVVDNDPKGTAIEVIEKLQQEYRWPLFYVVEKRQGIPFARNKVVETVSQDSDFIVFIDDDEVPEPLWLDELLFVQQQYQADVVSGPVIPYFNEPVEDWIKKGKFFDRERFDTGHPMKNVATNNVLIHRSVFNEFKQPFDERFALSGGSDTHFFFRVYNKGYKMVWANDAIVYEWVPSSRANVKWLLRRAYRVGTTLSLCERDIYPSIKTRLTRIIKGFGRVVLGMVSIPITLLLGKHVVIQNLRKTYLGAGFLAGIFGKRYAEYKQIHGD